VPRPVGLLSYGLGARLKFDPMPRRLDGPQGAIEHVGVLPQQGLNVTPELRRDVGEVYFPQGIPGGACVLRCGGIRNQRTRNGINELGRGEDRSLPQAHGAVRKVEDLDLEPFPGRAHRQTVRGLAAVPLVQAIIRVHQDLTTGSGSDGDHGPGPRR